MGKPHPIDVQKALKGAGYPTDKKTLSKVAKKNGADKDTVDQLAHMKKDRFKGPNEVEKEIFK